MTNNKPDSEQNSTVLNLTIILLRIVLGAIFVFSGFSKAVDPWGGYYKISEYLQALEWTTLIDFSLFASFSIAALEFVLGVLLLVGSYRRVVPLLLILLMMLMTPLTLWLAVTNAVDDCGCFGDALHLSNWATFAKNVLLLAGLILLFLFNKRVHGIYGPAVQWIVAALSLACILAVAFVGYFTQPLIDFRPFQVGKPLVAASSADDNKEFLFIYEKDGQRREFTIDSLPDEEQGWNYIDRRPANPQQTSIIERPGHHLALLDNSGLDVSPEVLAEGKVLLLLFQKFWLQKKRV